MKKQLFLLFACIACCFVHSCKNFNSRKENLSTMLIFENAPNQLSLKFEGVDGTFGTEQHEAEIAFIDSNGAIQYFAPNRELDTLIICSSDEYVEIFHLNKVFENLYFYIKAGDTVLFTYDDKKYPSLKSYTSEQLTQQYNFLKSIPERLSYFDFESLTLLSGYPFWRVYIAVRNNEKNIPKSVKALYISMDTVEQQAKIYLQNYSSLLERQGNEKIFSASVYDYYNYLLQTKIIGKKRNLLLNNTVDSLQQCTIVALNRIYDGYFDDEHCRYVSYLHAIGRYGYLNAYTSSSKFPVIAENTGSSGRNYVDYKIVFDSISLRLDIPPKTRAYMLKSLLDMIVENFSVKDIECYAKKYIALIGDSIRARNNLLENGITETKNNDILLKDEKGNEFTFEDIRKQLQGKIIYLDFWASWCAPCRSAMPEALKLRKKYERKDVAFLYLALNDREDAWKKAIKKLQLNDNRAINYFITNSKLSKTIQELKVESIPRYIIYDKAGKITYFNASEPGKKAYKVLDELLK